METVSVPLLNEHLERVTVGDVNIYKYVATVTVFSHLSRWIAVVLRLFLKFQVNCSSYFLKNNFDIDCVTV